MSSSCAVPSFPPNESDYESFERSWITRDLVDRNGIRRVDDAGGRQLVGRKGRAGNYAGWYIPYFFPSDLNVRGYRLRRDEPDAVYKHGQLTEDGKYLSAFGDRAMAYFPVGTLAEWLDDAGMAAVIGEGEKKTISLFRLSLHNSLRPRWLVIGLAGVWGWRGRIGRVLRPNGGYRDLKGVIPDFDRIKWEGRLVYIVFDSDVDTKPEVAKARIALSQELVRRGARIRWVSLLPKGITV